jgi:hypothetical protein
LSSGGQSLRRIYRAFKRDEVPLSSLPPSLTKGRGRVRKRGYASLSYSPEKDKGGVNIGEGAFPPLQNLFPLLFTRGEG